MREGREEQFSAFFFVLKRLSSLRQRNHVNFDQNLFRQPRDLDG
jgi:hypothetical protein